MSELPRGRYATPFGKFIRHYRKHRTLAELYPPVGLHPVCINMMENGQRKPFTNPTKLHLVADALGLPPGLRAQMYDLAAKETRSLPADLILDEQDMEAIINFARRRHELRHERAAQTAKERLG